jgi:hypothetical protein
VLAVGITAGTVTFSVVDGVLLKPLPLDHSERIVSIPTYDAASRENKVSPEAFWQMHDLPSLEAVAARSTGSGMQVTARGVTTDAWAFSQATLGIFDVLGLAPMMGRVWTEAEEASAEPVAVLGYQFWRERFNGESSALGDTVDVEGSTYRVIGVLPAESADPELVAVAGAGVWVPLAVPRTGPPERIGIVARMRAGVSTAQVAGEVQRLAGASDWRPEVRPILDIYVDRIRSWMLLALGAAALIVLIACVNAANLLLTRSAARAQELAVRVSLGASRLRTAGTMVVEGLFLSCAATACAIALALGGVRLARIAFTTMALGVFRPSAIVVGERVLLAAAAAAIVTGVFVSPIPAWQAFRTPVSNQIKNADGVTATGRRQP